MYTRIGETTTVPEPSTTEMNEFPQGRIRFCALILNFDENLILNTKFTIYLYKIGYFRRKCLNIFRKKAENIIF